MLTLSASRLAVVIFGALVAGLLVSGCAAVPKYAEPDPQVREVVVRVADSVLERYPEPPRFDWGEGVLLAGMMDAYELTEDERYLNFAAAWADHWHAHGLGDLLAATHYGELTLKRYCGIWGPAYPLLRLYEETENETYLTMAQEVIDFMLDEAERTANGGLSHFEGNYALWDDTLWMACPVFSHASRILDEPKYQREAVDQLLIFADVLQDPATGLFYHMWSEKSGTHTTQFWCRGNGWVAMSYTDTLKHERRNTQDYALLTSQYGRMLQQLERLQDDKSGLWHTVLNAPETYLETSGSAMILYALIEARRWDWVRGLDPQVMRNAWAGLLTQVDSSGKVVGVSGGTGPSSKLEDYTNRPQGTHTWGTGAFLMAACSYATADLPEPKTRRRYGE